MVINELFCSPSSHWPKEFIQFLRKIQKSIQQKKNNTIELNEI